jgi:hypothetical protein
MAAWIAGACWRRWMRSWPPRWGLSRTRWQKMNYANAGSGSSVTAMGTNIFWADPVFAAAAAAGERLQRTVAVRVFAYQEAGEL